MKAIGEGDLTPHPAASSEVTGIQVLSEGFERMVEQRNELVRQNRQEQISLRKAELSLLQAQIDPYFLYNTLDTIVWLIEMEQSGQADRDDRPGHRRGHDAGKAPADAGFPEGHHRTGFGLVTIHERIQFLFGKPYGLEVDSDPSGTTVTVRIAQSQTMSDPLEQQETEA